MNELRDKLWPAFLAETGEQVETLELVLLHDQPAADVNAIFRLFHTIKSSCAMMGFGSMEQLTHAAEDLLDLMRRGELALDTARRDLLLRVVDALRRQLETARKTRDNPPAESELVAALRADAALPLAPAAAPAMRTTPASLAPFAARAAGVLHLVFQLEARGAALAKRRAALDALGDAAAAAGIIAIASLARRLQPATTVEQQLPLLAELATRLRRLETSAGVDCGVAASAARLATEYWPRLLTALNDADQAMQALAAEFDRDARLAPGSLDRAAGLLDGLACWSKLLALDATVKLLGFARQVLKELRWQRTAPGAALLQLMTVTLSLPAELDAGAREDAEYADMCERAVQELRRAAVEGEGGARGAAALADIASRIAIGGEFLQQLDAPAAARLLAAVDARRCIVEIEADLESDPDTAERFIQWLHENAEVIGNRTVFRRQRLGDHEVETTRLHFVAAFNSGLADIKRMLGELDAQRRLFELQVCGYPDGTSAPESVPEPAPAGLPASETLRVDSATLDVFVSRIGEMVMLRNMLSHALDDERVAAGTRRAQQLVARLAAGERPGADDLQQLAGVFAALSAREERLAQADLRLQTVLSRLQEDVLDLRVLPMAAVFNRLPRVVHGLARAQSKRVQLRTTGEQTRIDKGLVDVLAEPLLHLLRNAVDHGIESPEQRRAAGKNEQATVSVSARQQGNSLVVEVRDDGRGLDLARIRQRAIERAIPGAADSLNERELQNLIFLPGFSTADRITETSGRGVGMDAVRNRVTQLGGQIEVRSVAGEGTAFELRLPLSIAIQGVVLVEAGGCTLALPERSVTEVLAATGERLQTVQGQAAFLLRGVALPVYCLSDLLGGYGERRSLAGREQFEVVVVGNGVHRAGVLVDRIVGRQEVFVREVHPALAALPGVGGASILGDGAVAIIVDTEKLLELAIRRAQSLDRLLRVS